MRYSVGDVWQHVKRHTTEWHTRPLLLSFRGIAAGAFVVMAVLSSCASPAYIPHPPVQINVDDGNAQSVENLINAYRLVDRLMPLTVDSRLRAAAQVHNENMRRGGCVAHTCPGEASTGERILSQGYVWYGWGEVLTTARGGSASIVGAWLNSPKHNDIIKGPSYRDIGCSVLKDGAQWSTCVVAYGDSRGAYRRFIAWLIT